MAEPQTDLTETDLLSLGSRKLTKKEKKARSPYLNFTPQELDEIYGLAAPEQAPAELPPGTTYLEDNALEGLPPPPQTKGELFKTAAKRGYRQTVGSFATFVGTLADDKALQEKGREYAEGGAPKQYSFEAVLETPSAENIAGWVVETAGEQLPNIAAVIAGAGAGKVGASIFGRVLGSMAGRGLVSPGAAAKLTAAAIKYGAEAGAFASYMGLEAGGTAQEQLAVQGEVDRPLAIGAGAAKAAIGTAALFKGLQMAGLTPRAATGVMNSFMAQLDNLGVLKRVAAKGGLGLMLEGTTEAIEEAIDVAARKAIDENYDLVGPEAKMRVLESFAAGGLIGGLFSGVGGLRGPGRVAPETPPELEDLSAAQEGAEGLAPPGPTMPPPGGPAVPGQARPIDEQVDTSRPPPVNVPLETVGFNVEGTPEELPRISERIPGTTTLVEELVNAPAPIREPAPIEGPPEASLSLDIPLSEAQEQGAVDAATAELRILNWMEENGTRLEELEQGLRTTVAGRGVEVNELINLAIPAVQRGVAPEVALAEAIAGLNQELPPIEAPQSDVANLAGDAAALSSLAPPIPQNFRDLAEAALPEVMLPVAKPVVLGGVAQAKLRDAEYQAKLQNFLMEKGPPGPYMEMAVKRTEQWPHFARGVYLEPGMRPGQDEVIYRVPKNAIAAYITHGYNQNWGAHFVFDMGQAKKVAEVGPGGERIQPPIGPLPVFEAVPSNLDLLVNEAWKQELGVASRLIEGPRLPKTMDPQLELDATIAIDYIPTFNPKTWTLLDEYKGLNLERRQGMGISPAQLWQDPQGNVYYVKQPAIGGGRGTYGVEAEHLANALMAEAGALVPKVKMQRDIEGRIIYISRINDRIENLMREGGQRGPFEAHRVFKPHTFRRPAPEEITRFKKELARMYLIVSLLNIQDMHRYNLVMAEGYPFFLDLGGALDADVGGGWDQGFFHNTANTDNARRYFDAWDVTSNTMTQAQKKAAYTALRNFSPIRIKRIVQEPGMISDKTRAERLVETLLRRREELLERYAAWAPPQRGRLMRELAVEVVNFGPGVWASILADARHVGKNKFIRGKHLRANDGLAPVDPMEFHVDRALPLLEDMPHILSQPENKHLLKQHGEPIRQLVRLLDLNPEAAERLFIEYLKDNQIQLQLTANMDLRGFLYPPQRDTVMGARRAPRGPRVPEFPPSPTIARAFNPQAPINQKLLPYLQDAQGQPIQLEIVDGTKAKTPYDMDPGEIAYVRRKGDTKLNAGLFKLVSKVVKPFLGDARLLITFDAFAKNGYPAIDSPYSLNDGALGKQVPLGNNVYILHLRSDLTPATFASSLFHETGHLITDLYLNRAPRWLYNQIVEGYENWRASIGKEKGALGKLWMVLKDGGIDDPTHFDKFQKDPYLLDFHEYMANNVMRALEGEVIDGGWTHVGLFFEEVKNEILRAYNRILQVFGLSRKDFTPDQAVKAFVAHAREVAQSQGLSFLEYMEGRQEGAASEPTDQLGRLMAQAGLPPAQVQQHQLELDRYSWWVKWAWGIFHVIKQNPHIPGVPQYGEAVRGFQQRMMEWITRADQHLREWQGLGWTMGDNLGRFLLDLTLLKYLPQGDKPRWPTNAEFIALAKKHGLSREALEVYVRIRNDFRDFALAVERFRIEEVKRLTQNQAVAAARIQAIQAQTKNWLSKPYFPLARFGDFIVTARDANGKVIRVEAFESERAMEKRVGELQKAYGQRANVVGDKLLESNATLTALPPALIESIAGNLRLDKRQQRLLEALIWGMQNPRQFVRHFEHRSEVPGFSEDAMRVYADYFFHGARHLARSEFDPQMERGLGELRDNLRQLQKTGRGINIARRRKILEHLTQHKDYALSPSDDLAQLRAWGFVWYLGFNVKSAFVNLTQIPAFALPHLGAIYGDAAAFASLVKWIPQSMRLLYAPPGIVSDPGLARALQRGVSEGFLDESQAADLAAFSEGGALLRTSKARGAARLIRETQYAAAFLFQQAERFNRRITFQAAYELALSQPGNPHLQKLIQVSPKEYQTLLAQGWSPAEAKAYLAARDAVDTTMFEYAKINRARGMWGKKSVIFLFYSYLQNALWFYREAPGGGRALLVLLLFAGLMGMPGAEDMNDLIKAAGRRFFGKDWDIEREAREFLVSLGSEHPDVYLHGASRYGLGLSLLADTLGIPFPEVDLSGSMSMGDLIPATEALASSGDYAARFLNASTDVGGAAVAIPIAVMQAIADDNPDTLKRWERALPNAVKNAMKGYRYTTRGKEETRTGATVIDFNPEDTEQLLEVVAQSFGFIPTRLSQQRDATWAARELEEFWKWRRGALLAELDYAHRTKDKELEKKVRVRILRFNEESPLKIKASTIKKSLRERERRRRLLGEGEPAEKSLKPLRQEVMRHYPELGKPQSQIEAQ